MVALGKKTKYFYRPMHHEGRPTCYRCFRPRDLCYCDHLIHIENRTRVVVLQHPRERFHPLGTARIAELSLKRCELVCTPPHRIASALDEHRVDNDALLLFPDPEATLLEDLLPEEKPRELIVLDGTWHHAKTFLRDVPALRRFRRVRFRPPAPSAYRIRREPARDYLSTVESIAHVLRQLEPDTPHLDGLLSPFHFMIDRNIALRRPQQENARFVKNREIFPHRFPSLLQADEKLALIVYCEGTSRWSDDTANSGPGPFGKEPLVVYYSRPHWSAPRRVLIRTQRPVPTRLLDHLALQPQELAREAKDPTEARFLLEKELGPQDVLVVCNASSYRILVELGVVPVRHLELKGIYCDFQRYLSGRWHRRQRTPAPPGFLDPQGAPLSWGGPEQVLRRHGIDCNLESAPSAPAAPPQLALGQDDRARKNTPQEYTPQEYTAPKNTAQGRGALRLRQTLALFAWLRQQSFEHLQQFQ